MHSADDRDPSLRRLFLVMGVVTALMIAAVIWTKVVSPRADRPLSVGEMRSIDRVCDTHCATQMRSMADTTESDDALRVRVEQCLEGCRYRLSRGQFGRRPTAGAPEVPTPARPAP